jgi:hypothetical protein
VTNDNPAAGTEEFLGRVHEVLIEQLKAAQLKVTPSIAAATATDPGAFLEILARHGLSLVGMEASRATEPGAEQDTGGTGIDVVIRAARAGKGCALDAERTAQVEAVYQALLSRIRDKETAAREAVARPVGAELDAHAVVDLLGHTRRIGRLTNCAEIPGFVQLTEADGTVRLVNPHKAIFEVLVVAEAQAEKFARSAGASWDSARGRVVPARWAGEDYPPFDDVGDGDGDGDGE